VQETVLKKFRKNKRKAYRKRFLTPGLDLADLVLKHEKLRSRRHLYQVLERDPQKVARYVKHLFGLTPSQKLTSAIFGSQGGKVLFAPWTLPKRVVVKAENANTFQWNPADFDDPKIQEAFRSTHMHNANDISGAEADLKLIRQTLRKLGKIDNLGLPAQVLDSFKVPDDMNKERMSLLEHSRVKAELENNSPYKNGTIVEVYSGKNGRWVLGEVIGAKSNHAINVRYLNQCKFLNPNDDSRFRLIEKIVATPYGIGFIQRIRHHDNFCVVNLDWGFVTVRGDLVGTMKVQKPPALREHQEPVVRGNLLIKVVKCVDLPTIDIGETCDPYVEIEIDDGYGELIVQRTDILRRNQNPKFHETLDFKAFELATSHEERRGHIRVYDCQHGETDDVFIGSAVLKLPTRNHSVEDHFLDLSRSDERNETKHTGVIVLQATLIRNELSSSDFRRKREHFCNKLGDSVRRGKKNH